MVDNEKLMSAVEKMANRLDALDAASKANPPFTKEDFDAGIEGVQAEYKKSADESVEQQAALNDRISKLDEKWSGQLTDISERIVPNASGEVRGHSGLELHQELYASQAIDSYRTVPEDTLKRFGEDQYNSHFDYLSKVVGDAYGLTRVPSLESMRRIGFYAARENKNIGTIFDDNVLHGIIARFDALTPQNNPNLLGTATIATIWANVLLQSPLIARLPTMPMSAPTMYRNTWPDSSYSGWIVKRSIGRLAATDRTAARVTIEAEEFGKYEEIEMTLIEDSVIDLISDTIEELTKGFAFALEDAVVNSDQSTVGATATGVTTANQNINNTATPATDETTKTAFNNGGHGGLRKLALEKASTIHSVGAKLTDDNGLSTLNAMAKMLGPAGVVPGQHTFVFPPGLYRDAMGIEPFSVIDKIGSAAAVLTGRMPSVGRASVIWSMAFPEATAAGGGIGSTPANNNKYSGIVIHPALMVLGIRVPFYTTTLNEGAGTDATGFANSIPIRARARFGFASRPDDTSAGNFGVRSAAAAVNIDPA